MSKTFVPISGTPKQLETMEISLLAVCSLLRKTQGVVRHKDGNLANAGKHSMAQAPMLN